MKNKLLLSKRAGLILIVSITSFGFPYVSKHKKMETLKKTPAHDLYYRTSTITSVNIISYTLTLKETLTKTKYNEKVNEYDRVDRDKPFVNKGPE
jgi:hypothetical protein